MKTTKESAEVGVVIGRFQVPDLHSEHRSLIQKVVDLHPRVFVFLGLASDLCKGSFNNPLDFHARKAMLEELFPSIEVLYIKDKGDDEQWSRELDAQIETHIGPGKRPLLYGSRDSFIRCYKGKYDTEELVPDRIISGTEIRKNVGIKSKKEKAFREGVIWTVENQPPMTLPQVSVVIQDTELKQILLVRRFDDKPNVLRFPGKYSPPESKSFEEDAFQSIESQTGLTCNNVTYLGSAKIEDWKLKGERNQSKSLLFLATYEGGTEHTNEEIQYLQWVPYEELKEQDLIKEHVVLLQMFKEKVLKQNLKQTNVG